MTQRKLAAIMFTDIVSYTALMGSDEDQAFEILRKNREIHLRCIEQFRGALIKEMGDGMLAKFESAADSVGCAIEIQKETLKELEAKVRIGIHLGDTTLENHDVFGDGVNIASRLQSIADPGGIYISDPVYSAIRSKRDIKCQYLGEVTLKNVNYPFKTYFIKSENLPVPSKSRIDELTGKKKTKSVVVLPFDNYTGSEDLAYFVSGMHASLIGSIGKVGGMRVISKTTANAFKHTKKSIPEIASELGVHAVVEASVLSLEEKISLQVKLIDASAEEKQLWMEDYVKDKSQILNLYNTITKEITKKINIKLTAEEEKLLAKSRIVDREAYDAYLKSYQFWEDFNAESLIKAKEYLNEGIEKDPDWAPLYVGMANVWIAQAQQSFEEPAIAYPAIYECLDKALGLDPDLPDCHYLIAITSYLNSWEWSKAEKEFLKSLAGNPNDPFSRIWYGHLLCVLQRPAEGLTQAQLAYELDQLNPFVELLYLWTQSHAGNCVEAQISAENFLVKYPDNFIANQLLNLAAFNSGDYEKVIRSEKNQLNVHFEGKLDEDAYQDIERTFTEQGFSEAYNKVLSLWEELANNKFMLPCDLAVAYIKANQIDKAMNLIEEGYEIRDPTMPYMGVMFNSLFEYPRFIEIWKKMNLPLPQK
jgi:adenylate cyclase